MSESSPLALMEAMATGIPTVATNVGSIKETLGQTGWVVKNNSPQDLADKLIYIIDNKSSLKNKSNLARERVISKYSQKQMLKGYELIYKLYL